LLHHASRSAEALLPPHKCGGFHHFPASISDFDQLPPHKCGGFHHFPASISDFDQLPPRDAGVSPTTSPRRSGTSISFLRVMRELPPLTHVLNHSGREFAGSEGVFPALKRMIAAPCFPER
jgi:hypothetical protein